MNLSGVAAVVKRRKGLAQAMVRQFTLAATMFRAGMRVQCWMPRLPMKRPNRGDVLDCASPLALSDRARRFKAAEGLPHSKTLARPTEIYFGMPSRSSKPDRRGCAGG